MQAKHTVNEDTGVFVIGHRLITAVFGIWAGAFEASLAPIGVCHAQN
jgi:hypothetical protein